MDVRLIRESEISTCDNKIYKCKDKINTRDSIKIHIKVIFSIILVCNICV